MFFQQLQTDERLRSSTRYAAAIWLGVTQVLLAGVVFYRLYVLGQPDEQIRDFQTVLAISIFGYLALQLFLGGVMPVPTWKGAIVMYLFWRSRYRNSRQRHRILRELLSRVRLQLLRDFVNLSPCCALTS